MMQVVGWRGILILAAICSLTLSVATRYCVSPVSMSAAGHAVKTRLAEPKMQHLVVAKDGAQGLPQVARLAIIAIATYEPRTVVQVSPAPLVDFENALSNRPPPLASRLL